MPLYAVHALDKSETGPGIRAENRPAHIEWAKALGDKLRVGGPLLSDDGDQMIGSFLIIDYESLEALKDHLETDPYAIGGLFQSVSVKPFKWLLGVGKPGAD